MPESGPDRSVVVDLHADPGALQGLGRVAGDVAAGEGVKDELARRGQDADEEVGQAGTKAGFPVEK